jgi:prepilin-type N-terminal cleavage/methylation domain-containing protein
MNKQKLYKGFSLVELIIVIAVLALLAVGSVAAFVGIQANARRSMINTNASALVSALNNYNVQVTTAEGLSGTGTRVVLPAAGGNLHPTNNNVVVNNATFTISITVPARGVRAEDTTVVVFDSLAQMQLAVSFIDYTPPPPPGTGVGRFSVATADIGNSDGRTARPLGGP